MSAAAVAEPPSMNLLRYFDVVLLVVAAPILLLIGVSAVGYLGGAGAWIALRAAGEGVEHLAGRMAFNQQIGLRLGFLLGRLFILALAVILIRKSGTRDDGLAALLVIVGAFTIELAISFATRPRRTP